MQGEKSENSGDLAELLDRVASGNRAAFEALYSATKAKLFGVALRIINNREDAAEVLQEVYLRIWHHAAAYNARKGAPMTWMIAITRNRALDRRRRIRADIPIEETPEFEERPDDAPSPLQLAIGNAESRQLYICMDELSTHQQQCLLLAYREGLTHSELAVRLDQPLGTVKSAIRRGLFRLKECLNR